MEYKKVSPLATVGVFSLAAIGMGITVVTPAMQTLSAHWAEKGVAQTDINMISTLPTLVMVFVSLIAGALAGKKVKFRTLAIIGCLCFIIGGCLPAVLTESFAMVLFGRFLFGVGVGFVSPLANALILGLYEPKTASAYLGYSTLLMNFGGIIFQYLGGVLSGMGWNYTFWGHLPAIISLIMSFFLVEPDKPADNGEAAPKEKMSPFIWVTALVFFLFNLGNYPLMMYMSFVFMAKGAGDAVAAATALSIYTIAGCVAGAIFGKVFQKMGRFVTPIGFIISALGQFLILIGQNAVVMSCGTALIGFGFSLVMPSFFAYIGMNTPPSTVAFATSINMGLMNVSGFVCSYYLEYLVSKFSPASMTIDGAEYPVYIYTMFYWAIAISLICAVIFFVVNPMKKAQAGGPPPAA